MMPRSFPSATAYAFAPNPSDNHPNSCLRESLDDTESRALHGCSHKLARLPAPLLVCRWPVRFADTNASYRTGSFATLPTLAIEKPSPEHRAADRFASDCRSDSQVLRSTIN